MINRDFSIYNTKDYLYKAWIADDEQWVRIRSIDGQNYFIFAKSSQNIV